jgi:hypothetical protein
MLTPSSRLAEFSRALIIEGGFLEIFPFRLAVLRRRLRAVFDEGAQIEHRALHDEGSCCVVLRLSLVTAVVIPFSAGKASAVFPLPSSFSPVQLSPAPFESTARRGEG